jgi:hypothetical protein
VIISRCFLSTNVPTFLDSARKMSLHHHSSPWPSFFVFFLSVMIAVLGDIVTSVAVSEC